MRKEMERRNRGLRMGTAQFPPEFVWCCLQGQTAPPGSTAGLTPARLQAGNFGECGLRKAVVSLSSFSVIIWCSLGRHLP